MSAVSHRQPAKDVRTASNESGRAQHRVTGIIVAAIAAIVLWAALGVGTWALISAFS